MNNLKKIGRKYIFPLTVSLGVEKFFSGLTKNRCLVINYHGVVKKFNQGLSNNHISLDQFNKHLEYFKKHFNVISLSEAFHVYQNKIKLTKKTLAITFDDGYENNLTNAVPALNRYSFPATIFVTAGLLSQQDAVIWYDQLDLLKSKINYKSLQDYINNFYPEIQHYPAYSALKNHFKDLNKDGKEKILSIINSNDEFRQAIRSCDKEYWKMMNEEQIRSFRTETKIEIGSHSVSHSNLDRLDENNLKFELQESRNILEKLINKKIVSIAFPDGAYNDAVKKSCIESGYKMLLAVNYHMNSDINDPMILPRLSISNTTTFESVMISIHRAFETHGF